MRTREDIEEMFSRPHTYEPVILLEVLLDIREMLMPLAFPAYEVTDVDPTVLKKYTGVFRTPTGDVITTKENEDAG